PLADGSARIPTHNQAEPLVPSSVSEPRKARADEATAAEPIPPSGPSAASAGRAGLVGRRPELTLLEQFLAGVGTPLLLLAGEPGIGKTRLLQAAARQASAQGWTVLAGGCQRRGGQDPYSPLLDALTQHLQALPPTDLHSAVRGCAGLMSLLPELADVLEPL